MNSPTENTILLTGVPRSGTTLLCACLNKLPNTIALAEPISSPRHCSADTLMSEVLEFTQKARIRALGQGVIHTKTIGTDLAPQNWFESPNESPGLRQTRCLKTDVPIAKSLTPDFLLYVKQPAMFTAISRTILMYRIPLFAIVRDPVQVLASWQTVDIPVHYGRLPAAERFDPILKASLDEIPSQLARQLKLLVWFFEQYGALSGRVLRYEDLISHPDRTLRRLNPHPIPSNLSIERLDFNSRYATVDLRRIAYAVGAHADAFRGFYPNIDSICRSYLGEQ